MVGGAFLAAGLIKVRDPASFAVDVGHFRVLPAMLIHPVAILLPWLEVWLGMLILAGVWVRAASAVVAGMSVAFLLAIAAAMVRGLDIECGCFGTVGAQRVGWSHVFLDLVLLGLAGILVQGSRPRTPLGHHFSGAAGVQDPASPCEALPDGSSAGRREADPFVCGGALRRFSERALRSP